MNFLFVFVASYCYFLKKWIYLIWRWTLWMKLLKELLLYAFSGQASRTLEMLNTGTFVSHAIIVKIFLHRELMSSVFTGRMVPAKRHLSIHLKFLKYYCPEKKSEPNYQIVFLLDRNRQNYNLSLASSSWMREMLRTDGDLSMLLPWARRRLMKPSNVSHSVAIQKRLLGWKLSLSVRIRRKMMYSHRRWNWNRCSALSKVQKWMNFVLRSCCAKRNTVRFFLLRSFWRCSMKQCRTMMMKLSHCMKWHFMPRLRSLSF